MAISYNKETWKPTDEFTETTANKWEQGIADCANGINEADKTKRDMEYDAASGESEVVPKDSELKEGVDFLYRYANNISAEVGSVNETLVEQKMLGWTTPKECPIKNQVSGNNFIQKVGRVDLGSLAWQHNQFGFYCTGLNNKARFTENVYITDKEYTIDNSKYYSDNSKDKICGFIGDDAGMFVIKDSSYTDVSAFKSHITGTYLYFELATPITLSIDGATALDKTNASLDNYGLVNVFDGQLSQGAYDSSTGAIYTSGDYVCSTTKYSCKGGDIINLYTEKDIAEILFWNGNTYISSQYVMTGGKLSAKAPSNATLFALNVGKSGGVTPQTVGKVAVYVNNAIDKLNNDLGSKVNLIYRDMEWSQKHNVLFKQNRLGLILVDDGTVCVFIGWNTGDVSIVKISGSNTITATKNGEYTELTLSASRGLVVFGA